MKPHKNLFAWQKSMALVDEVYKVTKLFPNDENLV
ncbi:MAG: four helix bundle protein [Ignavibacteriaceae bacterium]